MLKLRNARTDDSELIVQYIKELAAFEHLSDECVADPSNIQRWLFSGTPKAYCLLAEWDGAPAGFAIYFYTFSTFLSKPGIYIEDVFVRENARRNGIASGIFQYLERRTRKLTR